MAVPRSAVLEAVDDCAAAGVRALVVVAAGFAEADAEGRTLQAKLLERVRGHGMRLVGPNSMGLVNTEPGVQLNASVFPDLPPGGHVAMSSQSGALGLAMLALARQRHVGISTFISVGNKADVSGNDLLQYWHDDEATRVILLYLESFGNPRRFARLARSVSRGKPVVVVKAGRRTAASEAGAGLASLVAGEAVVNALFRQTGVIRADTLDEMFDLATALDRQPLPNGRRVAILSDGSGPGVLCAGACEAAGLSVPPLSDSTVEKIAAFLSPATTIGNPLELVFSTSAEPYRRAVEALLSAPETDSLVVIHSLLDAKGSGDTLEAIRQGVAAGRAAGGAGKPVLACLVAKEDAGTPMNLVGESVPTYAFPESAARVLGKVAAYAEWRAGPHGIIPDFVDIDPAAARESCRKAVRDRGEGWLAPAETRAVLRAMHLPVAPGGVARTADDAASLARILGYPVAVKLASHRIFHKTEKGAVFLNARDETAVRRAFDAIRRAMEPEGGLGPLEGVLVQPMSESSVEVTVSMLEDPSFGPLIVFGLGGIHLEVVADVSVRVTPLTDRAAAAMVREIRGFPLLEGYRAHASADLAAIHDVLLRVSRLVEEVPDIAELELSPIFVGPPGSGCRIVDSRIRVALPKKGQAARYTTAARRLFGARPRNRKERPMADGVDSGWLYRTIVDESPIAILFADREGRIRLWNAGATAVFGYSREEALGQSLDLIVPDRQRARHWEGWEKVMASGVTKYGRDALAVPAMKKDGSRISIEFNVILLKNASGGILGVAALIQDVTARWQQQKEMKARLQALEAKAAEG